jgi:hypothetical protein
MMGTKRDPSCQECFGDGWVYDYLGGCGDPVQVRCPRCDNDWSPDDEEQEVE